MMRITFTLLWALPILWLCSVRGNEKCDPAARAPVLHTTGAAKGWPSTVRGLGLTADAAKVNAFEQARKAVSVFLDGQQPPLRFWRPTRDDIDSYVSEQKLGPDITLEDLGVAKSWILTLRAPQMDHLRRLNRDAWITQEKQARHGRAEERLLMSGKIMFGALGLLVLTVGGLRVAEKMPRRYARLLVAGMIGVAACIVVGLFLVA